MRKGAITKIAVALMLLFPGYLFCQWTTVDVGSTGDLSAIDFEGNTIFLGGQEFVKSTDGGNTWNTYPLTDDLFVTIFGSELYDIHFFDQNTGVATGFILTGNSEVMLRTTNGGLNWSFVNVFNGGNWPRVLNDIDFPTSTTGYAVGSNGRILKSSDTGQTWSALASGTTRELLAIHFMNATTGIAVGDGIILRTTNGGSSWTPTNFPGNRLADIHFINASTGVVSGSDGLLKTTDGGNTWAPIPGSIGGGPLYLAGADTIFVAGNGIYASVNGGNYFLPQPSVPANESFNEMDFFNGTVGYAVGEDGLVRRTSSFGDPFPLNDAGVVEIEPFPFNPCPDDFPVRVKVKNIGLNNLTQVTIHWEVNGQVQTPYVWSGNLAAGQVSDFITIGSYFFSLGNNPISAWTSDPNAASDDFVDNDTTTFSFALNRLMGTYTIGGVNPDFQTIGEAIEAIKYPGVCGTVVFNIRNGIYYEENTIPELQFAPDDYEIVFQSASGNYADVTLTTALSGFPTGSTLVLNGAKNITIQNITIKSNGVAVNRPIEIKNGASNIQILNNRLEGIQTNFHGDDFAVIYVGGPACRNLVFRNNMVRYGSIGLLLGATPSAPGVHNIIEGNTFENQNQSGIYGILQQSFEIRGNNIFSNLSFTDAIGIQLMSCSDTFSVFRNIIRMNTGTGIRIESCNVNGGLGWLYNNFITIEEFIPSGASYLRGIWLETSYNLNLYFNSIKVQNNNAGTPSNVIVIFFADPNAYANINLRNNVLSNEGGGVIYNIFHSIFNISISNIFNTIDNNAYHFTGDIFATADVSEASNSDFITSLTEWKILLNKDFNSFLTDPQFISDLHIYPQTSNYLLNGAGTPIVEITDDIDGEPRDPLKPDIGADEFAQPGIDVGVTRLLNSTMYCSGENPVYAVVKNYGADTLLQVEVQWSVNAIGQTPFSWTGVLLSGEESAPVLIGNYNFTGTGSYTINVWTSSPNGVVDLYSSNDAIYINVASGGLAGVYTIGGASPDFPTFVAARTALIDRGVCGPVLFKVRAGIYNEQVSFPQITGASADNTITFEAENGYNVSVLLTYSANSTNDYTLQLDGADYFTFRNMSFAATNNVNYNTILYLKNSANYNSFLNNRFLGLDFPGNYNEHFPINSASSLDEFNLFESNTIVNGTYAIWMKGNLNHIGPVYKFERGNRFINNTISGAKHKSIYLQYQQDPVLEKNSISLQIPAWAPYTNGGMQLENCIGKINIIANRITGSAESGMWLYGSRSSIRERGLIANNFVSIINTSEVTTTGAMVLGLCANQDVFFNNLLVNGPITYDCFPLYMLYSPQFGIAVKNNNCVNLTNGGAALFLQSPDATVSDYNNFYAPGGALVYHTLGVFSDLSSFQVATGFDLHSLALNPLFVSDTDLHLSAGSPVQDAGVPMEEITVDADGEPRDAVNPDIGADEFSVRPVLTFEGLAFASADSLVLWDIPITCGNEIPYVIPCDSLDTGVFHLRANAHCSQDSCFATGVKWFIFDGITLIAEGTSPLSWANGQDLQLSIPNAYSLFTPGITYTLTLQYDCGMCSPCECSIKFLLAECGACACLGFSNMQFHIDGGAVVPAQCNQEIPAALSCPTGSGISLSFEGSLHCTNNCATTVEWEIRNSFFNNVLFSGSAPLDWQGGSENRFTLPALAFSNFPIGNYKILLKGHCGDAVCECTVNFYVSICDVCTCPNLQEMKFISEGDTLPATCNNQELVELACPASSATFSFEGKVLCSDSCGASLNYRILSFNDALLWSGTASVDHLTGNLYQFSFSGIPYNILSTFAYNRLEIFSACGGKFCNYCNIYFTLPECDFCCIYPDDFNMAVENATTVSVNNIGCEATLHINNLPNCGDYIDMIHWGDGTISMGPYISGAAPSHTYTESGDYTISYTAFELDGNGQACFEKQFNNTIAINCAPCDWPGLSVGITGDFPFDGNADDISPTNKDGVVSGATLTTGHDGAPNSAYHFNGVSSLIDCTGNNRGVANEVSVCAWVKTTEQSRAQWVAGKFEGYFLSGGKGYRLAIGHEIGNTNIGKAGFGGIDASGLFYSSGYSSTPVNDGEWHCLVGVAGGQSWKIYVDGALASSDFGGTTNMAASASVPLSIGGFSPPVYPAWMNGDIDNVRIYNRALTAHEVDCFCNGSPITSNEDLIQKEKIQLFPNPNTGVFEVELYQPAVPGMALRVIDLTGRVLVEKTTEAGSKHQTIQANALPAGLYFLQVVSEGKVMEVEKFVKQ